MAHNDANRNTNKATNYPNQMQRPMMFNKDGGQQTFVGHFAARTSQRYVFSTHEEVVKFGRDHGAGDKSPYTPRSTTEKSNSLPPNSQSKGSLPPERPPHHYYNTNDHGKYNHVSSNDDKSEEDNYKMDAKPKELSYDNEKNKRNGYAPPANYTIPYNLNKETPNNINNVYVPPNNNVYVPPKVKNIPQIKTRIGDPDFTNSNPKKPTNYNASQKTGQGSQEVINSLEARTRYSGMPSTRADEEEKYEGTISCKEAARKYNGVFVPK